MTQVIELKEPISDEDLAAYSDVVGQQVNVWTECTGENNTATDEDYAREEAAIEKVKAKQATLVKKLELSLAEEREGETEGGADGGGTLGRGGTVGDGNITRGT